MSDNATDNTDNLMEGFTAEQQEQLQKIIQSETDKVRTSYVKQVKGLEDVIKEHEEKQKEYEKLEKQLKTTELLEKHNIPSELAKFIEIDVDNEEDVTELAKIFNAQKLDNKFVPSDNRNDNTYDKAIKDGNIEGALKQKISRLFSQ